MWTKEKLILNRFDNFRHSISLNKLHESQLIPEQMCTGRCHNASSLSGKITFAKLPKTSFVTNPRILTIEREINRR